jgi:hypothetical protein
VRFSEASIVNVAEDQIAGDSGGEATIFNPPAERCYGADSTGAGI